jgi:hypothetical protein
MTKLEKEKYDGTVGYTSPEVDKGKADKIDWKKNDIYGVGIIMLNMQFP